MSGYSRWWVERAGLKGGRWPLVGVGVLRGRVGDREGGL